MSESSLVLISSNTAALNSKQLDTIFDKKNDLEMITTMQAVFQQLCNGEDIDAFVIPIIKNVSTSQCKPLKRILHMFWPQIDCYYANGTLKPYMILICNSILNDLKYPNEFIVCSALRCVMGFQAREVVQHLTLAIPPLLTHENEEVRATAAIAIRVVNQKFSGLVSTKKLEEQLFQEKNCTVLRQIIVSLAQVSKPYFAESVQAAIEPYRYFEDHYEVGLGVLDAFEELPGGFQAQIIRRLRLFESLNYMVYYQAGRALLKFYEGRPQEESSLKILAAQCLLQSCKQCPQSSVLHIIDMISNMELQAVPNASQVAQALAQVFTGAQQQEEIQRKLFSTRLFQKICVQDPRSSKQIVDSLTSSRIMETQSADLYFELVNTVYEVASASDGFGEINVAGAMALCGICVSQKEFQAQDKALLPRLFQDACLTSLNILKEVALAGTAEKKIELMKGLLKIIFQTRNEDVFKNALWELVELIPECGQEAQFAAALVELLQFPENVQLEFPAEVGDFLVQEVQPLLYSLETDDSEGVVPPLYTRVKHGEVSFLSQLLIQAARRVAYLFPSDDSLLPKLLVGASGTCRGTKFIGTDGSNAIQGLQDLYVYLQTGKKNEGSVQVVKRSGNSGRSTVTTKASARVEDGLAFSLFESCEAGLKEKQAGVQKMTQKRSPYERIAAEPALISQVYQLSADADLIYAEALVTSSKTQIQMYVLYINRTASVIEELELELFTSGSLKACQSKKKASLEPHGTCVQMYEISVSSCTAAVVYGNICARFQQNARERHKDIVMRIKEISFSVAQFLKQRKISLEEFRRFWAAGQSEFRVETIAPLSSFLTTMEKLQFKAIMTEEVAGVSQGLFAAQTLSGDFIFVVYATGGAGGTVKIRSTQTDVAEAVAAELRQGI